MKRTDLNLSPLSFDGPRPVCHRPGGRCEPAQAHTAE